MESGMAAFEKLGGMLGLVSFGLGRYRNDRCLSGCKVDGSCAKWFGVRRRSSAMHGDPGLGRRSAPPGRSVYWTSRSEGPAGWVSPGPDRAVGKPSRLQGDRVVQRGGCRSSKAHGAGCWTAAYPNRRPGEHIQGGLLGLRGNT